MFPLDLFRNLKIGAKIAILVALPTLLMALMMGFGIRQINTIGKEVNKIVEEDIPILETLNKITAYQSEELVYLERAILLDHSKARDEAVQDQPENLKEKFLSVGQGVNQEIVKGQKLLEWIYNQSKALTDQNKAQKVDYELRGIQKEHSEYQFNAERTFNLLAMGKREETEIAILKTKKEKEDLEKALQNLFLAIGTFTSDSVVHAKETRVTAIIGISVVSILILFFSLSCGIALSRNITKPLMKLTLITSQASIEGTLPQYIDITSKDEIGELAFSFNKMTDDLKKSRDELTAAMEKEKELAEAEKKQAEELRSLNQQLKANEQQLKAANQQLKAGEQGLKAVNQQLGAKEQELKAKMVDLERFNKFMVGRELVMVELKAEVNSLLEQLGQPTKYKALEKMKADNVVSNQA